MTRNSGTRASDCRVKPHEDQGDGAPRPPSPPHTRRPCGPAGPTRRRAPGRRKHRASPYPTPSTVLYFPKCQVQRCHQRASSRTTSGMSLRSARIRATSASTNRPVTETSTMIPMPTNMRLPCQSGTAQAQPNWMGKSRRVHAPVPSLGTRSRNPRPHRSITPVVASWLPAWGSRAASIPLASEVADTRPLRRHIHTA